MSKSINHLATADGLFFGKGGLDQRKTDQDGRRGAGGLRRRRAVPRIRAEREPGVRRRQAEERLLRHHPGLRPALGGGRGDGLRPCLGARRAGAEARRRHGQGGARRQGRQDRTNRRAAPTSSSMPTTIRSTARPSPRRSRCCRRSTPMCAARSPRRARSRSRSRAPGRWSRSSAPAAGAPPTCARWCGSMSAWSAPTAAAWKRAAPAAAGAPPTATSSSRNTGSARPTRRSARRWSTCSRCRRRPARCRWCWARAGRACCGTRRSATGWKATSIARRPRCSPA